MKHLYFSILFLSLLLPLNIWGQNFSNLAGGRSTALAHSSVALEDIWASHHNQAALAFIEKPTIGLSAENRFLIKDLLNGNVALAYPTKLGTLGLSVNYFGFELYNQSKIGLNYARTFSKYFAFGLQLNYESFYVEEGNGKPGSVTFEVGILGKPSKQLNIGFHLYNPAASFKNVETEERLPVIGRLGAQYRFSDEVALSGEVKKEEGFKERYALGFEYSLLEVISLRAGVGLQPFTNTFGVGVKLSRFTINAAYEYAQVLQSNATLSLEYSFK